MATKRKKKAKPKTKKRKIKLVKSSRKKIKTRKKVRTKKSATKKRSKKSRKNNKLKTTKKTRGVKKMSAEAMKVSSVLDTLKERRQKKTNQILKRQIEKRLQITKKIKNLKLIKI